MLGKLLAGFIGGLIVAILASVVFVVGSASGASSVGKSPVIIFYTAWGAFAVMSLLMSKAGKAWRLTMVTSAILCFMLPLASLIFTGSTMSDVVNNGGSGAELTGSAMGGGLITILSGFLGFFLGIIFLVVGMLSGRESKVVIVRE